MTHESSDEDGEPGKDHGTGTRDGHPETDGGVAEPGEIALDPWGSSTVSDYRKLFDQFGIERFEAVVDEVPNPHYLIRRGVIFGHRDYRALTDAMDPDSAANGSSSCIASVSAR